MPDRPDPSSKRLDLLRALEQQIARLAGGPLDDARWTRIGHALRKLHDRFVDEQMPESGAAYLQDPVSLAAYLAYFFPASQGQVRRALAELEPPARDVLRVLDVGCGPGPALFAAAEWAAPSRIEATALDASAEAVQVARVLWTEGLGTLNARAWRADDELPKGPFDLIIASHVLNELFGGDTRRLEKRQKLVEGLAASLAPGGLLVLVEPALRRTGRELLVIRDRLLGLGLVARAPCFYQGACPAIARPRDWCHADRPWQMPPLAKRAAEAADLDRASLKYSYVILSTAAGAPARSTDAALFRIVSEPLPENGKLRYFGCGPSGRHALVRLEKERTAENDAFDTLERGDVVRLEGLTASGDGKRLGAGGRVQVVQAARTRDDHGS